MHDVVGIPSCGRGPVSKSPTPASLEAREGPDDRTALPSDVLSFLLGQKRVSCDRGRSTFLSPVHHMILYLPACLPVYPTLSPCGPASGLPNPSCEEARRVIGREGRRGGLRSPSPQPRVAPPFRPLGIR